MEHYPAVKYCVFGSAFLELAVKTVFEFEMETGKGCLVIQMGELVVEVPVLIIPHLYHAILRAKRFPEIHSRLVVMDLYDPIAEIPAVKKRDPFTMLVPRRSARAHQQKDATN